MKKVAVTGGLACGKSSVCQLLAEQGAYVISADDIVHTLLHPHSQLASKIVELLGKEVVQGNALNKEVIAQKVFEDKKTLKALEAIIHPAVLEEMEKTYNKIKDQANHAFFVAEIPLLYEIESAHLFDTVIAVVADPKIAKKRYKSTPEDFEKRMSHQLPPSEKSAKADFTIINNGNWEELKTQVHNIIKQIQPL